MPLTAHPGARRYPPATPTRDFPKWVHHRSEVIIHLARKHGWTRGVEIGTGEGRTTEKVLAGCPNLSLATVDPWIAQPGNPGPETWEGWDHSAHMVTALRRLKPYGDRVFIHRMFSQDALPEVEPRTVDFVFIDGDHSTEAVVYDVTHWEKRVRRGGMVIGHDINWPTVQEALKRCAVDYWVGPDNTWGFDV